ncbi:MAG: succinate dehydrogenase, hydrophobic membrane anchor protein [Rhodobacteraceae bacterium]|nr:succinate dehydrogenase, hydrophobic membrane anchor protein [Paracoccaceae bacterium]MCY4251061.1 succinate dehydrogenase, hydrophobic membrane anchor protein [Paracoccaceae bacterium]MCY4308543.1 succinate dehydrogenase, hydrophobic membrane anchor protein [Paracoccaceae bacterium]
MEFQTNFSKVDGLGSSKEGTHHWWMQRLSAVALVPLSLLFVYTFLPTLGSGYQGFVETYSNLGNAIAAILFLIVAFFHLRLGLQVVIEDYVHSKTWKIVFLISNTLFCWGLMAVGVISIARIAFGFVG